MADSHRSIDHGGSYKGAPSGSPGARPQEVVEERTLPPGNPEDEADGDKLGITREIDARHLRRLFRRRWKGLTREIEAKRDALGAREIIAIVATAFFFCCGFVYWRLWMAENRGFWSVAIPCAVFGALAVSFLWENDKFSVWAFGGTLMTVVILLFLPGRPSEDTAPSSTAQSVQPATPQPRQFGARLIPIAKMDDVATVMKQRCRRGTVATTPEDLEGILRKSGEAEYIKGMRCPPSNAKSTRCTDVSGATVKILSSGPQVCSLSIRAASAYAAIFQEVTNAYLTASLSADQLRDANAAADRMLSANGESATTYTQPGFQIYTGTGLPDAVGNSWLLIIQAAWQDPAAVEVVSPDPNPAGSTDGQRALVTLHEACAKLEQHQQFADCALALRGIRGKDLVVDGTFSQLINRMNDSAVNSVSGDALVLELNDGIITGSYASNMILAHIAFLRRVGRDDAARSFATNPGLHPDFREAAFLRATEPIP